MIMLDNNQKKYLDLLKNEPYKLGHWIGFNDLTELHNTWIKTMLFSKQDETLQAHRGSYKTTCLSIAISEHLLMFPNRNIIFIRKTDDDVVEIIGQVQNILKSDAMQYISSQIYGSPIKIVKANASEVITNLSTTTKGASQLLGLGIKGSLTGKHADLIITDDIVNLKDRISQAERNFTKQVYMELQNIKNRGGRILNTGTPWHKDDCFQLMPNIQRFDCYQTGLISKEQLEAIRNSLTPSLFAANYELKHIASETALFNTPPKFTSNADMLRDGNSHIDAAYGGADGSALTLLNKHGDDLYVLGKLRKKHIDDCINEFILIRDKFMCGSFHSEDNGDKGYLAKEINRRGGNAHRPYHENMNKYIKISSYIKPVWGNIYFHEETDPEYISEILDYTEDAEHDDAPDSLASSIRLVMKAPTFSFD